MSILSLILEPITNIATGLITANTRKKELEAAKHQKTLEGIQAAEASEFAADIKRTEDLSTSWKDEYITIVVSIPAILSFFPWGAPIVADGFISLSQAPDWYQWLLIAVFSVGAGVPLAAKTVKTLKSINNA